MARLFDRNIFIMLLALMVGIIIITYFAADIINKSTIETLNIEHKTEIVDIASRNENFTDNFLQGTVKIDSARETREYANYFFDFALLWYNSALAEGNETKYNIHINGTIDNCTQAINKYQKAYQKFQDSWPYFENAKNYTDREKYLEVLEYYTSFAIAGQNLTNLRIQSSTYLKYLAENLTFNTDVNLTELLELFNETLALYEESLSEYDELKGQIDEYLFFDEIREEH